MRSKYCDIVLGIETQPARDSYWFFERFERSWASISGQIEGSWPSRLNGTNLIEFVEESSENRF